MSSGEKKHDYHLVDPSPWPIFTSFACLVLALGAVYYFHTKALWLYQLSAPPPPSGIAVGGVFF